MDKTNDLNLEANMDHGGTITPHNRVLRQPFARFTLEKHIGYIYVAHHLPPN